MNPISSASNEDMSKYIYTGDSDPVEWFKIFEVRCAFAEWDDAHKLEIIESFLDAKAKRAVDAARTANVSNVDSYAKIKTVVTTQCKKSTDALLYMFYSAKRTNNESISKYARRLQDLLNKAMPTMVAADKTTLLRAQLCNEVPENLRALIQFSSSFGDGNWDKILDMLDKTLPTTSNELNRMDIIKKEKTEQIDTFNVNVQRNDNQNNRGRGKPMYRNTDLNCYTCGQRGHKAMHCSQRVNISSNASRGYHNNQYRPQQGYQSGNGNYNSGLGNRSNSYNSNSRPINTMSNDMYGNSTEQCWDSPMQPFYSQFQQEQNQQQNKNQLDQMFNFVMEIDVACIKLETKCLNTLLRVEVRCTLFDVNKEFTVMALVDGGSTHTLMSPDVLTNAHKKVLLNPQSLWVRRRPHRINGILGGADSNCFIVNADLAFKTDTGDDYNTEHEFVISAEIRSHQMILGRDFLKAKQVTIDHGKDHMIVADTNVDVKINFVGAKISSRESSGSDLSFGLETDAKDRHAALSELVEKLQNQMKSMENLSMEDNTESIKEAKAVL